MWRQGPEMDIDVKIKLPTGKQVIDQLGLGEKGEAQMFHTANVLRRIQRYMPFRTGATIKLTIAQTDIRVPEIVTQAPHAVYIYKGLSRSGKPLNYTRTKNPMAGPYWDETVVAFEGEAMAADLQRYLDRRAK